MCLVGCVLLVMNNLTSRPLPTGHAPSMHSHWLEHDHAPLIVHIMVGLFITAVGLVAIAGNILVVLTCVRYKELRTRSNILIINLAVGDLLMCSIDFPLLAISSFLQGWPFGWTVCRLYAFLTAVAGLVTINTLGCISADRYWAVVWRTNPRQQTPRYVTALVVMGVWVYAIAWAICPILGWGDYVLDGIRTTCTFDYLTRSWSNRTFVIAMVFGNFILPFVVMLFSYTKIWMTVCDVKRTLGQHPGRVVVGMHQYPKSCSHHRHSMTPVEDGKYYCLSTDNESEDVGSKIVVTSLQHKPDCWTKAKSVVHELVNEKGVESSKQDETQKNNNTVGFFKNYTSSHAGLIICQLGKGSPKDKTRHPIRYVSSLKKNSHQNECKHCQGHDRIRNPNLERCYSENKHAHKEKSKHCIVRNQKIPSPIEFNNHINSKNDPKGSSIRKFRFDACSRNKLYLKQHRYRLHCEYKTVKIIMYLLMAFIISWFPYVVVSMIGLFGDASRITYLTSVFPSLVAKSSMVFNPILYSISHPKVRKRIFSLFFKKSSGLNTSPLPQINTRFSSSFSYSR